MASPSQWLPCGRCFWSLSSWMIWIMTSLMHQQTVLLLSLGFPGPGAAVDFGVTNNVRSLRAVRRCHAVFGCMVSLCGRTRSRSFVASVARSYRSVVRSFVRSFGRIARSMIEVVRFESRRIMPVAHSSTIDRLSTPDKSHITASIAPKSQVLPNSHSISSSPNNTVVTQP